MEVDLTKMKVADLKKELKIRGLAQTGKRTELLERLQVALAGGVGIEGGAEDDGDEEYDEDEILGGDDADDDDSKMTPLEEAAALAAAEKAAATPMRGARRSVAPTATGTPRTAQKKLALRRTTSPSLVVQEEAPAPAASPVKAVVVSPLKPALKKAATPVKAVAPSAAAEAAATGEPPKKIVKLAVESDKENGDEPAAEKPKSALELRAERFGVKSDQTLKTMRAERFGVSNGQKAGKLSMDVGTVDVEKLKARASRFGETVAKQLTQAEIDEKKKLRSERFGNEADSEKKDVTSSEVLAARAAKFGDSAHSAKVADIEPIISASGKKLITIAGSVDEVMKTKRAARFGA